MDSPGVDRRDRSEDPRGVRRENDGQRRPEQQWEPRRRDDARSSQPEMRSRRSEAPRVDRAPAPRPERQQGRSGDSGSRGGGRKR
jgi:hypothetical protein